MTSKPQGAAPVPSRDPYKIADVLVPWTTYEYEDDYASELEWPGAEYDARTVAKGKSDEARNRVRQYLAMNGAAVWVRVERSLSEAARHADSYPGASIVAAVTATELSVRFLLLRPLVAGLVFNTRLAMTLVREGLRPEQDRRMLPHVCRAWGIEVEGIKLPNGHPLWDSLKSLIEVRNMYVHRAEPVEIEQARGAIDCAQALLHQIVEPLAARLGLTWPPAGWTHRGRTHDPVEASYDYMGS